MLGMECGVVLQEYCPSFLARQIRRRCGAAFSDLRCAFDASGFFRVFWVISEGGIYSDLTFAPKRAPLIFDPDKDLTAVKIKLPDGVVAIRNGFFFSKKDCNELKIVACEIMKSVSKREIQHVRSPLALGYGQKFFLYAKHARWRFSSGRNCLEILSNFLVIRAPPTTRICIGKNCNSV